MTVAGTIILGGGTVPGDPNAGEISLYTKGDGILYYRDDAGNETTLGAVGTPLASVMKFSGALLGPGPVNGTYADSLDAAGLAGNIEYPMPACNVGKLRVNVPFNTFTQAVTVEVEINSNPTGIAVTIPAGATGAFSELAFAAGVADGDLLLLRATNAIGTAGGTVLVAIATLEIIPAGM